MTRKGGAGGLRNKACFFTELKFGDPDVVPSELLRMTRKKGRDKRTFFSSVIVGLDPTIHLNMAICNPLSQYTKSVCGATVKMHKCDRFNAGCFEDAFADFSTHHIGNQVFFIIVTCDKCRKIFFYIFFKLGG